MTDVNYTQEDVIKIYESFVTETFKNSAEYEEVKEEFRNFKADVLSKLIELDEGQFEAFALNKAAEVQHEIQSFGKRGMHDNRLLDNGDEFWDFSLFKILKIYTDKIHHLEAYLSSFRIHDPKDLAVEWKNEDEKISINQSPFITAITPTEQIDSLLGGSEAMISYFMKNQNKTFFRLVDLGNGFSYIEQLLFSIFIALTERKMTDLSTTINYFTNLYNISHHFGLKTEHFLLFNSLCKYFQYIIYSLLKKEFRDNALYQAFVINLLSKTAHNGKIVRGIVHLLLEVVKISIEFLSEEHLRKILTVHPKDPLSLFKREIDRFISQAFIINPSHQEINFKTNEIVKNFIRIICFCFKSNLHCILLMEGKANETIEFEMTDSVSYPTIVNQASRSLSLILYGQNDWNLVDGLKAAQQNFDLDKFLSVNNSGEKLGNKGNLLSNRFRELR